MTPEQKKQFMHDLADIHAEAHGASLAYHQTVLAAADVFSRSRDKHVASLKALEARMVQANTAHASARDTVKTLAAGARQTKQAGNAERIAAHEKAWAALQAVNDGSPQWEARATACLTKMLDLA